MTFSPLSISNGGLRRVRNTEILDTPVPCCRIWRNSTQSIPSGVWTAVSFNSQSYRHGGTWVSGSTYTNLVMPAEGIYQFGFNISAQGMGDLEVAVSLSGSLDLLYAIVPDGREMTGVDCFQFSVNNFIRLRVRQNTGVNQNLQFNNDSGRFPGLWATRIRPLAF